MLQQSLWSVAAAFFFSLMAAFVKLSSGELGSLEMVFYRSLIGVITIWLFVRRNHFTLKTPHIMGHMRRSVLGTLSIAVWFYTLGQLPFGTNMTLIYTTPLFMAANFIVLAMMRHERAPWGLVGAIVAGFLGIAIVLQPSISSEEIIPALICLGVSLLDLVIYWEMKQLGRLNEPSWRIVFYFTLCGTIFGLVGAFLWEGGLHLHSWNALIAVLGMGVCATLGQVCTTRSYAYGNMLLSSCLGFSAIPISAILSWLLFGESTTVTALAGMSLIIAAGVAATISTKRTETRTKEKNG